MKIRHLPVNLTLPIPGVQDDWPELLLPTAMTSEAWSQMLALLEVMRPGVVHIPDRRLLLTRLATAIQRGVER